MKRRANQPTAFTLIELLVVVAIIALLISILLPSLSGAREQARTTKCLSNLKQIGHAMHMYFDDEKNWFPFEKRNMLGGAPSHAFYYGGHPGRPTWWGYSMIDYRDTPKGRPFNRYIYNDLSDQIDYPPPAGLPEPEDFKRRRQMPIYECPSDRGGTYAQTQEDGDSDPIHRETGSSYDSNWQFVWYWAAGRPPIDYARRYLQRSNAMLQKQLEYHASRFLIIYEDPFDVALFNRLSKRGWHRQWNKHSGLFLDGHAANLVMDPRQGNYGGSWKTLAHTWYVDVNDPDYKYRDVAPR